MTRTPSCRLGAAVASLVAALAAATLAAAPAQAASQARQVSWSVVDAPFRVAFSSGGRRLAESVAGHGIPRLSYTLEDGSRHAVTRMIEQRPLKRGALYWLATDEPGRQATLRVVTTPHGARVTFAPQPAAGVESVGEAFASRASEHFLGSGERGDYVDLRGQAPSLVANYACAYVAMPFYASSAGYGISVRGRVRARFAFPATQTPAEVCGRGDTAGCPLSVEQARTQVCVQGATLSYDVFMGGFEQVSAAYAAAAGKPRLPDPSAFALMHWRDAVGGSADVLGDVRQLRRHGIPQGWEIIDNPWEPGCIGRLVFDRTRFPAPGELFDAIHASGVRVMLWVSPMVTCPGAYAPGRLIESTTTGAYPVVDFRDPAAVETFQQRLERLLTHGVDGFKADRGADFDLGGALGASYPYLYGRAVGQVLARHPGAVALFQAGSAGSQATIPALWAGDQPGDFVGLQRAVRAAQTAGVSGYPFWGSDTGGYSSADVTPEQFVRWAQLSAVSPVFEVGGNGPNATFWQWDAQTIDAFRDAAILHYELFPYLYGLARVAAQRGTPIIRPLGYAFPRDVGSWGSDLEFMVGPSLLAAPVTGPGTTPAFYLPPGEWVDLYAGVAAKGPASFIRETPLEQFPLYLRRGAAVRFDFRTPQVWRRAFGLNDLGRAGRQGWLYAPRLGTTTRPGFTATVRGHTIRLRVTGARERQVLVVGARVVGASVPRAGSEQALRRSVDGWLPVGGRFPGTVVKLGGGTTRVTLTTR